MRLVMGAKVFYAGVGEVHRVEVMHGVTNVRGVVHGWKVIGEGLDGLPVVSKRDLFDDEDAASKAAFMKKLKGAID